MTFSKVAREYEAMQWTDDNDAAIIEFVGGPDHWTPLGPEWGAPFDVSMTYMYRAESHNIPVWFEDWIIRDTITGELSACSPAEFPQLFTENA